jgi:uncharacterized membrane protein YccC
MIVFLLLGIVIGWSLSTLIWYDWAKRNGWIEWHTKKE